MSQCCCKFDFLGGWEKSEYSMSQVEPLYDPQHQNATFNKTLLLTPNNLTFYDIDTVFLLRPLDNKTCPRLSPPIYGPKQWVTLV